MFELLRVTSLDISSFDTSNVIYMLDLFSEMENLQYLNHLFFLDL